MEAATAEVTQRTNQEDVIKVSAKVDPKALAGAVSTALSNASACTLRAIGASAVNQACKALAIARGHVATRGLDLVVRPGMESTTDVTRPGTSGGMEISCMVFRVSVE